MHKGGFTTSLNFNNPNLYNNSNNSNSTKTNTHFINTSNINIMNNNTNTNYLLTKSNYVSNIGTSINNTNHHSNNFNSYLKSENLNSLNKSNELISPKNTFSSHNQIISTNRKLKDFVNLYSKKKFFKNPKMQVKSKEDHNNLGYAKNMNSNNNNFFLNEDIFHNETGKNIASYGNNNNSSGVRFKSMKFGNEKLLDF